MILATNTMLDFGWVVAYLVPYICLQIFTESRVSFRADRRLGSCKSLPVTALELT